VFSLENTKTFCLAAVLAWLSCAPSSADRTFVSDDAAGTGGSDAQAADVGADAPTAGTISGGAPGSGGGPGSGGASGGSGGSGGGGAGGSGGKAGDAGGDVPKGGGGDAGGPDLAPDLAPDGAGDGGAGRKALMVVGDPGALSNGDKRMQMLLAARGFEVVLADDNAAATGATGTALVVLCSSSAAGTLQAKYREVALPVLDLESAVFDDMRMTGGTEATDYDEVPGTLIHVLPAMQAHPLAAGKMGPVIVSAGGNNNGINWGKPAPTAIAVATFDAAANSTKMAIFGYEAGVKMLADFTAPARRVGLFAADTTLANLTADGVLLVNAAISWLAP
jgi:hypothetical protein